jgi:multidrug efflux system membrane fusion protein
MIRTRVLCFMVLASVALAPRAESTPAVIDWAQRVPLGVPVSGVVQSVAVRPGDRVAAGARLLNLDPTPFDASLTAARARLEQAEADWAEAERAFQRTQELYDRGVLATVELDHAKLDHTRARTALEVARSDVAVAQYRLDKSSLVAPFAAWVVAVDAEPGQVIASALQPPTLLVLGRAGRYLAQSRVSAEVAARFAPGTAVPVLASGSRYDGVVRSVGLEPVAAGSGGDPLYVLDVEFASGDVLRVGSSASLELP